MRAWGLSMAFVEWMSRRPSAWRARWLPRHPNPSLWRLRRFSSGSADPLDSLVPATRSLRPVKERRALRGDTGKDARVCRPMVAGPACAEKGSFGELRELIKGCPVESPYLALTVFATTSSRMPMRGSKRRAPRRQATMPNGTYIGRAVRASASDQDDRQQGDDDAEDGQVRPAADHLVYCPSQPPSRSKSSQLSVMQSASARDRRRRAQLQ